MIIPAGTTASQRNAWPLAGSMPPMAALLSAPAAARGYVANVLASWGMGGLSDVTELIVSELVANAVNASTDRITRGPVYIAGRVAVVRVVLLSDRRRVVAEVYDQAPGVPVIREARSDAESGRGLLVVAQTARQWGWNPLVGQHGKVVWAELLA
jgi:hypothetical protein